MPFNTGITRRKFIGITAAATGSILTGFRPEAASDNKPVDRRVSMKKKLIIPKVDRRLYDGYHFSPAVRVGDRVWVSGQVGVDESLQPAEGMTAQARLAFKNVTRVLEDAGATLSDVVELTTFHIDLRGELEAFNKVKDEFFPKDFPAWTAIGVSQLALPELRVEIRAGAVIGCGKES
jgi:enamine deaminase RidA (YjgF/YER057c/UK114 family)